ncbi:MAG TPA: hypothetical protein VF796_17255 [Humisphaera sp.]
MLRRLFTLLSAASLLLCVGTCALWVRSYWLIDSLSQTYTDGRGGFLGWGTLSSHAGTIELDDWRLDAAAPARRAIDPAVRHTAAPPYVPPPVSPSGWAFTMCPEEYPSYPPVRPFAGGGWGWSRDSESLEAEGWPTSPFVRDIAVGGPALFTHPGTRRVAIVPLWWLAVPSAVLPLAWAVPRLRRRLRRVPGHCRRCGYDLRASPGRCPECGAVPKADTA